MLRSPRCIKFFAYIHPSQSTLESLFAQLCSLSVAGRTRTRQFSSALKKALPTASMPCTEGKIFMARTRMTSGRRGGRVMLSKILDTHISPSMVVVDLVSDVSYRLASLPLDAATYTPNSSADLVNLRTEEFAMLEVSYAVARLIQVYPYVELPDTEPRLKVGTERQRLTLVVASDDGCRVRLTTGFN